MHENFIFMHENEFFAHEIVITTFRIYSLCKNRRVAKGDRKNQTVFSQQKITLNFFAAIAFVVTLPHVLKVCFSLPNYVN